MAYLASSSEGSDYDDDDDYDAGNVYYLVEFSQDE